MLPGENIPAWSWSVMCVAVLALGCGDDGESGTSSGPGQEAGADAGPEAGTEAGSDATMEVGPDASEASIPDALADVASESAPNDAGELDGEPDAEPQDAGPVVFQESGGLVSIEAEHFATLSDNGTERDWYVTTATEEPGVTPDPDDSHAGDASGGAYLEGLPDTRVTDQDTLVSGVNFYPNPGTGPIATYRVQFTTTGRYYLWVRAYSTGAEDNGVHVGIDDDWPGSGERMQWCSGKNQWTWSNAQRDSGGQVCGVPGSIYVDVATAGEHTIAVSMREDGFEFDKIVLTDDEGYEPQGDGPPESL
jgi:Gylcosyl hydrolase family 115 C-terminal domain